MTVAASSTFSALSRQSVTPYKVVFARRFFSFLPNMRQIEDENSRYGGGVLPLLLGVKLKVLEKDAEHPYLILDDWLDNIPGCCQSAKSLVVCMVIIIEFCVLT